MIATLLFWSLVTTHLPFSSLRETPPFPDDGKEIWVPISRKVTIGDYFNFMDSLVSRYDTIVRYPLTEHLLVHANPHIMDILADTDYYRLMEKDSFVYNQKKMIVIQPGDSLLIPDTESAYSLLNAQENTYIDINIPEFRLRIYRDSTLLHSFPIRVGRNTKRYLAMANRVSNLRTINGKGTIVRHARYPAFYNPVDGKRFYLTKRDDGKTTLMPQIPWIETEINGIRNGQMIHPTTNPETLGKASSNGCIGTREADMWYIYYHAPIGTMIHIRYDLTIKDKDGKIILLKDIYNKGQAPKK